MSSVYNNHWNSWNCNNTESELGHVVFATAIRRENGTNLWENPQGRQRQQWVQAFKAKFSKAEQVRQEMLAKVAATADDKKEKTADTKAAANARSVEPHYEQQYVTPNPYITSNPYVNKTPNPYLYQGITPEATPMHYYESPKAANYGNYSEVIDHGPDATSRIDVGSEVWVLDSKTRVWQEATIMDQQKHGYMVSFTRLNDNPRSEIFIPYNGAQIRVKEVPPCMQIEDTTSSVNSADNKGLTKEEEHLYRSLETSASEAGAPVSPEHTQSSFHKLVKNLKAHSPYSRPKSPIKHETVERPRSPVHKDFAARDLYEHIRRRLELVMHTPASLYQIGVVEELKALVDKESRYISVLIREHPWLRAELAEIGITKVQPVSRSPRTDAGAAAEIPIPASMVDRANPYEAGAPSVKPKAEDVVQLLTDMGLERMPYFDRITSAFPNVTMLWVNYSYLNKDDIAEFQAEMGIDQTMTARGILKKAAEFHSFETDIESSVAETTVSMGKEELLRIDTVLTKYLIARDSTLANRHGDLVCKRARAIDIAFSHRRISQMERHHLHTLRQCRNEAHNWHYYASTPSHRLSALVKVSLHVLGIPRTEISSRREFLEQ